MLPPPKTLVILPIRFSINGINTLEVVKKLQKAFGWYVVRNIDMLVPSYFSKNVQDIVSFDGNDYKEILEKLENENK